MLGQLSESFQQHLGVAHRRQGPGCLTSPGVLALVGAQAQLLAQQAQVGAHLLELLAGVVDGVVGKRPAPAQGLQRFADLLADQAADAARPGFVLT